MMRLSWISGNVFGSVFAHVPRENNKLQSGHVPISVDVYIVPRQQSCLLRCSCDLLLPASTRLCTPSTTRWSSTGQPNNSETSITRNRSSALCEPCAFAVGIRPNIHSFILHHPHLRAIDDPFAHTHTHPRTMSVPFDRLLIGTGTSLLSVAVYEYPFVLHIGHHVYHYTSDGEIVYARRHERPAAGFKHQLFVTAGNSHVEIAFGPHTLLSIDGFISLIDDGSEDAIISFARSDEWNE